MSDSSDAGEVDDFELPAEVLKQAAELHGRLTELESAVEKHMAYLKEQGDKLSSADSARAEIHCADVTISAMEMLARIQGFQPEELPDLIKEKERLSGYSHRLELVDKHGERPSYSGKTVGRFVKHALWQPKSKETLAPGQAKKKKFEESDESSDSADDGDTATGKGVTATSTARPDARNRSRSGSTSES